MLKKPLLKLFRIYKKLRTAFLIYGYEFKGKKPWSKGYFEYKWQIISQAISSQRLLELFKNRRKLPDSYGVGIDERVVEYPWVLANLPDGRPANLLDAGSALNFESVLNHPKLKSKKITIVTLTPESNCFWQKGVSYVYSDMRSLPFKDDSFDIITCISTLEHVGMDNSSVYNAGKSYKENKNNDYLKAVLELKRVLKLNGQLLITVPFGKYENHGFFQQFNSQMINNLVKEFNPVKYNIDYLKYSINGWHFSEKDLVSNSEYFDIRKSKKIQRNKVAAARAVACIELTK